MHANSVAAQLRHSLREFVYELTSSWPPARVLGGSRAAVRGQDPGNLGNPRKNSGPPKVRELNSGGLRLIHYLQYKRSIWPAAPPPESPQIAPWPLRGPLERLWGSPCCPEGVPRAPKELPEQPQGARRASQGGHDNPSFGNLGQDGRSGGILTTPRSGISMRICLDRSKASKQL